MRKNQFQAHFFWSLAFFNASLQDKVVLLNVHCSPLIIIFAVL